MTFWLVDSSASEGEYPDFRPYIAMPDYNDRDWSKVTSKQGIKKQLKAEDEMMPPEHVDFLAQTIWRFVGAIEKEDIICLVDKKEGKAQMVYFAEVVGDVTYSYQLQQHQLPVEWFKEKVSMKRLWAYRVPLGDADKWPIAIGNKKLNLALRNHLPLPGNRFAKWAMLILMLFVVVKLTRMYNHM